MNNSCLKYKYIFVYFKKLIAVFLVILTFSGCEKSKDEKEPDEIYPYMQDLMEYWYLWNDELKSVDISGYNLPQDMMDDMIMDIDRWSFVDLASNVTSYFNEGEDFGFGFFLGVDNLNQLRVIFVYNNTTAYANGIRRGCIITRINDIPVQQMSSFDSFFDYNAGSMKFDFIDNSGLTHTLTLSKETYNMNGILYDQTYSLGSSNVGYMVLNSFLGYVEDDLNNTIASFVANGISDLIIDLRYNSGGYIRIAHKLANIIIPEANSGDVFYSSNHNDDRKAQYDEDVLFNEQAVTDDLNLDRIFFLTNRYSASASELLINGLIPYIDVYLIGDTTYGKPVAMYGFEYEDWLLYPVTAKLSNADGYGDFFNGILPTLLVPDFHKYNWGDINEPLLKQALGFIGNGSFNPSAVPTVKSARQGQVVNGDRVFNKTFAILDEY